MAFNQDIPQFTTQTSNHCDNFNEVNNLLFQNTMENKNNIQNLDINCIKNFALPCFQNGTGDMNTFLQLGTFDTGSIFTNRISNGPVSYGSESCVLITNTKASDNTIFQEFYIYADDGEGQKFYRCVYGNTYDSWQEYARKGDIKRVEDKVTVLSDRGFLSQEKFVSGNLIDYIKNIPVGKSISVYVGTHNVSNIPASGGFFLMQLFRNSSTGDCHIQAQEFVGNNLTGNQWVADLWNFTDDKIHWERVLTEDNGIIKGLDNDLDNNRGIRLLKSDTQIEPTADMYSKGHMELRTLGAIPILGFHTQGKSACSLYEKNGRLHIIGNDDKGGQLATTDKIDISLFNGWVEQYDSWNSTSLQIIGGEVRGSIWIKNASITQAWATILSIQGATFLTKSRPVLLFSTTTQSQYIGQFNNSALACPSNIPVGDYIITF